MDAPSVHRIEHDEMQDSDRDTIQDILHPESSTSEDELEDVFEVEEPPSINNVTTIFFELCDGATDHNT